jgi:hypothetical protein
MWSSSLLFVSLLATCRYRTERLQLAVGSVQGIEIRLVMRMEEG